MARLAPVSWSELITRLRELGFEGPYQGGKHPYMVKENLVLSVPNPHRTVIGVDLLRRILNRAGMSRKEWLARNER